MPNLRIMWFHHNECDGLQHESAAHFDSLVCSLVGTIPPSLGESHSIISMGAHSHLRSPASPSHAHVDFIDLRYNPRLCGPLPPTLHVDWDWQWDNSQNVDVSWHDFPRRHSCNLLTKSVLPPAQVRLLRQGCFRGERVRYFGDEGHIRWPIVRDKQLDAQMQSRVCAVWWLRVSGDIQGTLYDDAASAVTSLLDAAAFGDQGNIIRYDPFPGPRCCESDLRCVVKDATFSQCIPKAAPTADHAFDGATDLALLPKKVGSCSAPETQCGSSVVGMYSGPTTCCDSATRCVKLNSYYSRCLTEARAKQALAQFGADANEAQSVVVSWGHGGGAATLNTSAPVGGGFRR